MTIVVSNQILASFVLKKNWKKWYPIKTLVPFFEIFTRDGLQSEKMSMYRIVIDCRIQSDKNVTFEDLFS